MSAATATITLSSNTTRPNFWGLVGGELFKLTRQWTTWILLVALAGIIVLPYVFVFITPTIVDQKNLVHSFYDILGTGLSILRIFSGFFLLILVPRVIGLEYQLGTIRILLARGVGRLQLLFAKLTAVSLVALVLFVGGTLLVSFMTLLVASAHSDVGALQTFPAQFWADSWTFLLTILANMAVTILLATAATVVGRSLSFGLSVALIFFPIDNIGTLVMQLAYRITNSDFWLNVTAYLLGPNLNAMVEVFTHGNFSHFGSAPLVFVNQHGLIHGTQVDGTHILTVIVVYAVIFVVTAFWLTRQRDVKE